MIGERWGSPAVEHEQHLTAEILGAVMCYLLVPHGDGTRLLLKIVIERRRWYGTALAVGDWPMARRQLLNLKALAERGGGLTLTRPPARTDRDQSVTGRHSASRSTTSRQARSACRGW